MQDSRRSKLKRSTDKEANCKKKASHINNEKALPRSRSALELT